MEVGQDGPPGELGLRNHRRRGPRLRPSAEVRDGAGDAAAPNDLNWTDPIARAPPGKDGTLRLTWGRPADSVRGHLEATILPPVSTPRDQLSELINGYRITQMIHTSAQLGIFDVLAQGPRTAPYVAAQVGVDPGLLDRLMRALAAVGILEQGPDERFSNTEMGDLLREDVPGSLRNFAIGLVEYGYWRAWGELPSALRDGGVAFEFAHGQSFWDRAQSTPEVAAGFSALMAEQAAMLVPQLLEAFDFSGSRRVVDVGGGKGALVAGLLSAHPSLRATIFDLESGLHGADALLRARGVRERCDLVVGSFFDAIPSGADVYLLQRILHDWDDKRAAEILTTCRRAMQQGARLLVVESALPEGPVGAPRDRRTLVLDLHMHVMFGSRERTEVELRRLLEATGYAVDQVVPTSPWTTFIAVAA